MWKIKSSITAVYVVVCLVFAGVSFSASGIVGKISIPDNKSCDTQSLETDIAQSDPQTASGPLQLSCCVA
jgi:hypothetical protein